MNENVLDISYNSIIPEATRGSIDCFMYYNICFNTSIEGHLIERRNPFRIDTPLLEIRDKKEFDDKLCEYVKIAIEYYDDSYFYDEGMTVSSYPMELDSYLSFICNDLSDANNPLFRELAAMYLEKNKTK